MIDTYCRHFVQPTLITPVATLFASRHIQPKTITLFACIFGLTAAIFVATDHAYLGAFFLFLSGYFDCLDGTVSRLTRQESDKGALFDIFSDRLVEFAIIFALFWLHPYRATLCLAMLGSVLLCITSFLTVAIFTTDQGEKSFHYSPGIMERTEAFAFFLALILFPSAFVVLGSLFTLLVTFTALYRIKEFSR